MSLYIKQCPHCKTCIGYGHGNTFKHLGNPLKKCKYCGKSYLDNDTVEWSISPTYRKVEYFLSNNRWILFLFGIPLAFFYPCIVLPILAIYFGLCLYYVNKQVKKEMYNSLERTSNFEYIKILRKLGYPIKKNEKEIFEKIRKLWDFAGKFISTFVMFISPFVLIGIVICVVYVLYLVFRIF